ncbi:unnamed protein product [Arabidopsis lyrata]|nr:unnamed protein product [Arabidopsis lyrata]
MSFEHMLLFTSLVIARVFFPELAVDSPIDFILDLSAYRHVASSGLLATPFVPFGGSHFAFRRSFTAVCRFCSGLDPVSFSTRFDSGLLFLTVYLSCELVRAILWKSRNLLVFENRAISEEDTALKAITAAKEWQEANLAVHGHSRNRAQALPLIEDIPTPLPHSEDPSLILPLIEALSLNLPLIEAPFHRIPRDEVISCYTDAARIASSGSCGMGWIFKTQDHRVIHRGSATRLHTPSALAAEALALRSALIAASRMEFTSIKVFSDSQVLISLLNTETSTNELQGILHEIAFFSRSLSSIKFPFVPRKSNMLADALVKAALSSLPVLTTSAFYEEPSLQLAMLSSLRKAKEAVIARFDE